MAAAVPNKTNTSVAICQRVRDLIEFQSIAIAVHPFSASCDGL